MLTAKLSTKANQSKYPIGLAVFLLVAFIGLHCTQSTAPDPPAPNPMPVLNPVEFTAADRELAESSNGFGFEMFKEAIAAESSDENLFISPLSISYALGMTRNGAAGSTWDAMVEVLRQQDMENQEINQSYQNLTTGLTGLDPTVEFNIANSIWYRMNKAIVPEFLTTSETYFDAMIRAMDWNDATACDTINTWIEDATNGKIKKMIRCPVTDDVAMMLINAIYFKGAWTVQFDPDTTIDAPFYLDDGSSVDCRMMRRNDTVMYYENEVFQAVDLPYGAEAFSMTILLPGYEKTIDDILAVMTEENWALWMGSFQEAGIPLHMPRFKFSYKASLKDMLINMGMGVAFDPGAADFSNMFTDGVGWIGKVEHKTFVQVDEEGTEAAAATVVVMLDSAVRGMFVNKPFLFVIHEKETGTIVFMGRVANPVWEDD